MAIDETRRGLGDSRPERSGITRTGIGLALVGVGTTMLFGVPVAPLDQFRSWLVVGVTLGLLGVLLLLVGLRALAGSASKQRAWSRREREARALRLIAEIELRSARLQALQNQLDAAVEGGSQSRGRAIRSEIDFVSREGDLIADELRAIVGIQAEDSV